MADQTKTITIIALEPKSGMKNDGSGMWTKYNIKGHDGITYQTWDQQWFLQRKIGETIEITFYTTTFQGHRGLSTSYNIVSTSQSPEQYNSHPTAQIPTRDNPGANQNVAALIAELKRVEINIIAAIRAHCGTNIRGVEKIPIIEEKPNGQYEINVEEEKEMPDDNPF